MIRGGDFYAVWLPEQERWSTREMDAIEMIDRDLEEFYNQIVLTHPEVELRTMRVAASGYIDMWHKYCKKQCPDWFIPLDSTLVFANTPTSRETYHTHRLPYSILPGDTTAWDTLMDTLYDPSERAKLEWAVGSIISGDSAWLQKFVVLYGSAGTGKSTFLNILQGMFEGYWAPFEASALGSRGSDFALEAFKNNPLIGIQHDGDLSRIEDNTKLNSLVSHETMSVNEKFHALYSMRYSTFLFMGTNRPVRITDAKSGILRRLIDVTPSGRRQPQAEYDRLMAQITTEYGAIAQQCLDWYLAHQHDYDTYHPQLMLEESNDFYNFIVEMYPDFSEKKNVNLKYAWDAYRKYVEEANVGFPLSKRAFKNELKNYFEEFKERVRFNDGSNGYNYFIGFKEDMFQADPNLSEYIAATREKWLMAWQPSIFDAVYADIPAQYASRDETPTKAWSKVNKRLRDIDTRELHYCRPPENHIVIDFDLKDETGEKSFERNMAEAQKWPSTYAEVSKGGSGIHLHYIYEGDVEKLSAVAAPNVEIKIFTGKRSLRRRLTQCNNLPIATLKAGSLPIKKEDGKKVLDFESIQDEQHIRNMILKALAKKIHPDTRSNVDFIEYILGQAFTKGMHYDVTDMRPRVLAFAAQSTHQAEYCVKAVSRMQFASEDPAAPIEYMDERIAFYDIEVYPNLFLVVWKFAGPDQKHVIMINPSPEELADLFKLRLIGFNNRRYDNHICYAAYQGYTVHDLFLLSQKIIDSKRGDPGVLFGEAYNLSYTDVFDFSAKKQSLKKWEIELGIHHQEMGIPWDQPVPEDRWEEVAQYCCNDVDATEATFNHLKDDWHAREILATLAGLTVNDTTNTLTGKIIFGDNRKPQSEFRWRDMSLPVPYISEEDAFWLADHSTLPLNFNPEEIGGMEAKLPNALSRLPYFPGYEFVGGKSTYRGVEVGEGGYVYAEPNMHFKVALLDVASMHPTSAIDEMVFGPTFTHRFWELKMLRVYIKHEQYDIVKQLWDGVLEQFLGDPATAVALAYALKIAINSVYGLTAAHFQNLFRNPDNIDNIVAKRGALFMVDLLNAVQKRGFQVAHIKTDSIKIPNATPEIIDFVMQMGRYYGYEFEHEATYDKMCLVNNAVYICKYMDPDECEAMYGYAPSDNVKYAKKGAMWDATGAQFAVPYVFKTLFSHEEILFADMCETKSVQKGALTLDFNEGLPEGEHNYQFVGRVGQFCPMLPGVGGGELMCAKDDGSYSAVTGTKGYRWLESEIVKANHLEDQIDVSYYIRLVDDAVASIGEYGDVEMFMD